MDVVVTTEYHFDRTPDGAIWTRAQFTYPHWERYLSVYEGVRAIARVRDVPSAEPDWQRADGKGVSFAAVPDYLGPWQYLRHAHRVRRAAQAGIGPRDAVIMYNGQIGRSIEPRLRTTGHPFGLYIISEPKDMFSPGAVKHPLRPLFRWYFPRRLQRQSADAAVVAYVSKLKLERRYPPAEGVFTTYFCLGEMPDEAYVTAPRPPRPEKRAFTLIYVGTLNQLYKAPDVLIDAVAACVREGLDLKLVLVGGGQYLPELRLRAAERGIAGRTHFCGSLPAGDAVREQMDRADVLVLPSRQETLGQVIVEAMARGLPCIGSTTGGIPEMLPVEDLVPPNDVRALALKIREVVTDPQRMARASARNLEKAQEYRETEVNQRRVAFYRRVRETTQAWLESRHNQARSSPPSVARLYDGGPK